MQGAGRPHSLPQLLETGRPRPNCVEGIRVRALPAGHPRPRQAGMSQTPVESTEPASPETPAPALAYPLTSAGSADCVPGFAITGPSGLAQVLVYRRSPRPTSCGA